MLRIATICTAALLATLVLAPAPAQAASVVSDTATIEISCDSPNGFLSSLPLHEGNYLVTIAGGCDYWTDGSSSPFPVSTPCGVTLPALGTVPIPCLTPSNAIVPNEACGWDVDPVRASCPLSAGLDKCDQTWGYVLVDNQCPVEDGGALFIHHAIDGTYATGKYVDRATPGNVSYTGNVGVFFVTLQLV